MQVFQLTEANKASHKQKNTKLHLHQEENSWGINTLFATLT